MASQRLVHVIDDDEALRDSLRFLLEAAGFEVNTYDSAVSFLGALSRVTSGCVVTDVRMPDLNGLELLQKLREKDFPLPVIVMTGHADVPLAVQAMKAGVVDFIEKPFDDEVMISALEAALDRPSRDGPTDPLRAQVLERLKTLSAREQQVLEGLVAGKANKVVAYDLGISPRTVEVYRANVMTKMQAGSLSELVRMALLAAQGR